ncbi:MAG: hypothetical protein AABX29_03020 [Nanoarchaeota archaeon]
MQYQNKLGFFRKLAIGTIGGLASLIGAYNLSCSPQDLAENSQKSGIVGDQNRSLEQEIEQSEKRRNVVGNRINKRDTTPPEVKFYAYPREGDAPLKVSFLGSGYDRQSGISGFAFDFDNDGVNDPIDNFRIRGNDIIGTHTYENPGTFTPRLIVTNGAGLSASSAMWDIIVRGEPAVVCTPREFDNNYKTGNIWEEIASLNIPRTWPGVAIGNDNNIYVFGGVDNTFHPTDLVEKYNGENNLWEIVSANLNVPRSHFAYADDDCGRIYAIGGGNEFQGILQSVERFDPSKPEDGWQSIADLPEPRYLAKAVNSQGKIYVIGGVTRYADDSTWTRKVIRYNHETESWEDVADLNLGRIYHGVAKDNLNRIYAFSGDVIDPSRMRTNTVERFDPLNPELSWGFIAPIMRAQQIGSGIMESEGNILALGGWDGSYSNLVQAYKPEENSWSSHSSLRRARNNFGSVRDNKNRIYVIGGDSGFTPISSVERTVLTER